MTWALDSGLMIYVVFRETGEYSDRSECALVAYDNEAAAKYHVQQADFRAREVWGSEDRFAEGLYGKKLMGVWDPEFEYSYDQPRYYHTAVPKACLMMDELLKLEHDG